MTSFMLFGFFLVASGVAKLALAPAFILLFASSFVLRHVVVPLRWPRFAYWAARCCGPIAVMRDAGAGAALYGALALVQKPPSPEALRWLAARANSAPSVRGCGVVTAGLLAALRGERERARGLFLVADALSPKLRPASVRAVARDWLVADAARIGNWGEVIRLGRSTPRLRWSYAMARIGERLTGDPKAPGDLLLVFWWTIAPRRRVMLPLLRRAFAVAPTREPKARPSASGDELGDALSDLARSLQRRFTRDGRPLAQCVCAIEEALDQPSERALLEQRMLALGVRHDEEAVLAAFRNRLVDLLEPCLEELPSLARDGGRANLLDQAVERSKARLFKDVRARCEDYRERLASHHSLAAIQEWEAWAGLQDSADRLLALAPESEHVLFHMLYHTMCNFAVFQLNLHKRTALAHQIFAWLSRHAISDLSAPALLAKNMRACEV